MAKNHERAERRRQILASAYGLDPDLILLNTAEAGDVLSVSSGLMKSARASGRLLGRPAPPHVEMSPNVVRYRLGDLTAWLESALEEATRPSAPTCRRTTQGAQAHA